MAEIKLLDTAHGQNIRKMLEAGVKLGVSSRGSGNVDYNGIVSGFEIITEPSKSFFSKFLYEKSRIAFLHFNKNWHI